MYVYMYMYMYVYMYVYIYMCACLYPAIGAWLSIENHGDLGIADRPF